MIPLTIASVMDIFRLMSHAILYLKGFTRVVRSEFKITYWIHRSNKENIPIVVFPGVLFGIGAYFFTLIPLFNKMAQNRSILFFEFPWTELRPSVDMPMWDCINSSIKIALKSENINKFDIFCHSYGTNVAN